MLFMLSVTYYDKTSLYNQSQMYLFKHRQHFDCKFKSYSQNTDDVLTENLSLWLYELVLIIIYLLYSIHIHG